MIKEYYAETDATAKADAYALEAGLIGSDITLFAVRFARTAPGLFSPDSAQVEGTKAALHGLCDSFYKDYDMATDRDLFVNLMSKYKEDIAAEHLPSFFNVVDSKYGGSVESYANEMYATSMLVSEAKTREYIDNATAPSNDSGVGIRFPMGSNSSSPSLNDDLAISAAMSILDVYFTTFTSPSQDKFDKGYRLFVRGLREMKPKQSILP